MEALPFNLFYIAYSLTSAIAARTRRDSVPSLNLFRKSSTLMQNTSPTFETQVTEVEHYVRSAKTSCSPKT